LGSTQASEIDESTDGGLDNPYLNYKGQLINGLNLAYKNKKQIILKERMKASGRSPDHSESSEESENEED